MLSLLHASNVFHFADWNLQQVDLCFFLTRESFDFFVKMVTTGAKRKMGELLVKHMKGSRLMPV